MSPLMTSWNKKQNKSYIYIVSNCLKVISTMKRKVNNCKDKKELRKKALLKHLTTYSIR